MRSGKQHGFTYLSVVILVAIIGIVSAATLRLGVVMQRAAAEEELLRIGAEFSDALQSYASATPAGQAAFPPSLKELLKDPRFPQVRRHLRRIYVDPMTGKPEWGLIRTGINKPGQPGQPGQPGPQTGTALSSGEGGIIGIYSLSTEPPIKISNFPERFAAFEGKEHVADWKFTAETGRAPVTTAAKPGAPGAPGQPGQPGQPQQPQPPQPPVQPQPMPQPAPQEPPKEAEPPQEPPPEPPAEPEKPEPPAPPQEPV